MFFVCKYTLVGYADWYICFLLWFFMSFKANFPLFQNNPNIIYLDSAATLQKSSFVIDGIKTYLEYDYANIHRGWYHLSEKSELLYRQARKKTAALLKAKDNEIIFTANATDSVNKLAQSLILTWVLQSGDKILLSEVEHHANIVPRQIIAKQHSIIIDFVSLDATQQIDLHDLAQKLDETVKIVSLTMVSNVTGAITDVEHIHVLLDKQPFRPLLILDASQAVPHFSVNVTTSWADFIFFTWHKIGALTGVGILWGKQEHLKQLEPSFGGGGMVNAVTKNGFTLQWPPDKFEAGTPNLVGAVSLKLAIEYMEHIAESWNQIVQGKGIDWFYDVLYDLENPLMVYALEQFAELEERGVVLLWPKDPEKRIGVFSFTLPAGKHPTQLGQYMAEKNICIRCGEQCAHILHSELIHTRNTLSFAEGGIASQSCRMSLRGYNDISELKKFFGQLRVFLDS